MDKTDKTKLMHGLPRDATLSQVAASSKGGRGNKQQHLELIARGLKVGYPAGRSPDLAPADPVMEIQMILSIDEIRAYEHNPRRSSPNPQYLEIKESIRSSGLHNALSITRRPGDSHYIVEAGGNTRLQVLRELWEETKNEKFYRLSFIYKPWQSESVVLAKHLIENNVRGEMSFWDNATGFMKLKSQLEDEQGSNLSLRQFEELLPDAITYGDQPFGFWMEPMALDGNRDALQHIGWWALASISGQLRREVIDQLPPGAAWRGIAGADEKSLTMLLGGGPPDFLYFHQNWMLDQFPMGLFEIYIQILWDMRQLNATAPQRFDVNQVGDRS